MNLIEQASPESRFLISSDAAKKIKPANLPIRFLMEFIADGRTPARAMTDETMRNFLPALEGANRIIELGAAGNYYKNFAANRENYVTSNLGEGCDIKLDMTNLDLPDDSVDALVSVFALEHVYDFPSVFQEQYRVLKPGGRILLAVPFLYYYHAAPDDFFRFTESALDKLLDPLTILSKQAIGNRWLLFSELLHEKVVMGSKRKPLGRLILRMIALPFLARALNRHDPQYALGFVYLCEKS